MEKFRPGKIDLSGDAVVPEAKPGAKAGAPRVDEFYEDKAMERREKELRCAEFKRKKADLDAKFGNGTISHGTYGEKLAALEAEFADITDAT